MWNSNHSQTNQSKQILSPLHAYLSVSLQSSMEDESLIILTKRRIHGGTDLKSLGSLLRWFCVDQSSLWRAGLSWSVFFLFAFGVPVASHFLLSCPACDADHSRPYHVPVQISLSLYATTSFLCLSRWARKHGLRKFLFIDKLCDASGARRSAMDMKKSFRYIIWIDLKLFSFFKF